MLEQAISMFEFDNGDCPRVFVADSEIVSYEALKLGILIM